VIRLRPDWRTQPSAEAEKLKAKAKEIEDGSRA